MSEEAKWLRVELPPSTASPKAARALIQDLLVERPAEFVDEALLLTSELVTNAVMYTQAELMLSAHFDPSISRLRVEVADASPFVPSVPATSPFDSVGGRGLRIVAALARTWGVSATNNGKVMWFEVDG